MGFRKIRNLVRYILAMIFNIYIMITLHSYVNFLLLIAMIAFPIYSYISLQSVRRNVSLNITMPMEPMRKNEEVHVHFKLNNPTIFPIVNATLKLTVANPFLGFESDHMLNMPMRAKHVTDVSYPLLMEYCGRLVVNARYILITDIMGILEVKVPVKVEKECLLIPAGKNMEHEAGIIYQKGVTEATESKEKGYDFSEVTGIREYIPGDKLQNIHWKLSTKKDELMVKERVSVSAMQLSVVVDLVNVNDLGVDSILELTDSITKAFVRQNLPFTVYFFSKNRQQLVGEYVGNEVERAKWFESVLYDRCYIQSGLAEEAFLKENTTESTYLYIGPANGTEEEDAIWGENNTVAVLR